tara:strand:+ start:5707 stop:6540 length:834 start_codon:yes stop_codon:yes gene_type:complete
MMRIKHNKKRNTAFVYEALIREGTSAILQGDHKRKNTVVRLIKKHFKPDSILYKDLQCYQSLYETQGLEKETCEKIIKEAKLASRLIDTQGVFVSQTDLINDVNKELEPSVFNNFVPNYKSLANIYKMFSHSTDPKSAVILEQLILEHMSQSAPKENTQEVDFLVVESFVNKFNTKYDDRLLAEQKTLLNLYISSFVDNSLELKMFLNEEISRLKRELELSRSSEHISSDEQMVAKTTQITEKLESYKDSQANQEMLLTILKIQQLVGEINNDASSN